MITHKPPGAVKRPGQWLTGSDTNAQLPSSVASLRRQFEQAYSDYTHGRTVYACRAAAQTERTARTDASRFGPDAEESSAIAACAATLVGLCELARDPVPATGTSVPTAQEAFARALEAFGRLPEPVASVGEFRAYHGIALALAGAHGAAVPLLRHAVHEGHGSPDVRRALGLALWRTGERSEALRELRNATESDPLDWQTQELLATVLETSGTDPAELATVLVATSKAYLEAQRLQPAVASAERAATLAPDDFSAALALGAARAAAGLDGSGAALGDALALADSPAAKVAVGEALLQSGLAEDALRAVAPEASDPTAAPDGLIVLVQALVQLGRAEEAAEPLGRLKELIPQHPVTHLLSAVVADALGLPAQAITALRAADQADPGNPYILVELATLLRDTDAVDRARDAVHQALRADPHFTPALALRAQIRAGEGETDPDAYTEAIADLRQVVELDSWRSPAASDLVDLLLHTDRSAEALALVDGITGAAPDWGAGWALRGKVLGARTEYREAERSFQRAVTLQPDLTWALTSWADTLLGSRPADDQAAWAAAADLAARALALEPSDPSALALQGEALARQGQYEAAIAALGKAVRLAPDYGYAQAVLGQTLLAADRPAEAVQPLEAALATGLGGAWIHAALGRAYLHSAGDLPEPAAVAAGAKAAAQLEAAVQEAPDDPEVLDLLADALFGQERYEEAIQARRTLVDLDPDDPGRRLALVATLIDAGHNSEALTELDVMMRAGATGDQAFVLRGMARYWLDDYQGAVEDLVRTLPSDPAQAPPEAAPAVYVLGDAYRLLGRLGEALPCFNRVLALDPDDDVALASRGVLYDILGHDDEAVRDLGKAVAHNPHNRFALRRLWLVHSDNGRLEEGVRAVEQARRQDPKDPGLSKEYASVLSVADRIPDALTVLDEVLWEHPDDIEAVQLIGHCQQQAGERLKALEAYRRALRLTERTGAENAVVVEVLTELAATLSQCALFTTALLTADQAVARGRTRDALLAKGDILADVAAWPQALALFEEAVRLPPFDAYAFSALGWAREMTAGVDPAAVLDARREACRLSANNPALHKELADAYQLTGDFERAAAEYHWVVDRLAGTGSRESGALHNRGWCLYRLQDYDTAASMYQRALAASDDPASLFFDMGLNALEQGRITTAETAYSRALDEVARKSDLLARGPIAVALSDLAEARRTSKDARDAIGLTRELLEAELARRPLPPLVGEPVPADRSPLSI